MLPPRLPSEPLKTLEAQRASGKQRVVALKGQAFNMHSSELVTAMIGLLIVIYMIVRQFQERRVTWNSLRLPAIVAIVLGGLFLNNNPTLGGGIAIVAGMAFGLLTGIIGGQLIRVWRGQDGVIYQKGDWRYLVTLLIFIAIRIVARVALGHVLSQTILDDAFIAALIGNYLGRAGSVLLRVAPLAGRRFGPLPSR